MGWVHEMNHDIREKMRETRIQDTCTLCRRKVNMNDPGQRATHINGRRHQNLERRKF